MSVWHSNAQRGTLLWHRRQRVRRLHESGACVQCISRRLGLASNDVRSDLTALSLTPHPPVGVRLLRVLEATGWTPTAELVRIVLLPVLTKQEAYKRVHQSLRALRTAGLVVYLSGRVPGRRGVAYWCVLQRATVSVERAREMTRSGIAWDELKPYLSVQEAA